jgi:rubrerythrin
LPIDTVEDLRDHVQLAISVELSTIPVYLYAYYSIEDPADVAAKYIRSVATEEMLHATLMANVLLGVGGEPRFHDRDVMPTYPSTLAHHVPDLPLNLAPCSVEVVEGTFMKIEAPGRPGGPDQPDEYETLGQFYHAVEQAIRRLGSENDLFSDPRPDRQLHDPSGYVAVKYDDDASGGLLVVDSLETALAAAEVPIHQGEGVGEHRYADPSHRELTHHAKFARIVDGTVPLREVRPLVVNPTSAGMPDDVRPVASLANAVYSYLFVVLDRLYAADCEDRHALVGILYGGMVGLLAPVCRHLTTLPAGDGRFWGPPFEFHEFDDPATAEEELRRLGEAVLPDHPVLAPALRHLDRL